MNKKIKKILKILKKCYELKDENFSNYISLYQLGILLDYITNLEKYTDEIFLYSYEELQDKVINLQKENKHLKDLYNQALKDYDELLEEQ